jgi:fumarate reductase subunit D
MEEGKPMSETPMSTIQPPTQLQAGDVIREQDKIMLVLAYLGLLALIPLLTVKDSDYVKWHAKQGLTLLIAWIVVAIGTSILAVVPIVGWIIGLLGCFVHLGFLALSIIAIVKAFQPMRWRIPLVADLAEKINI